VWAIWLLRIGQTDGHWLLITVIVGYWIIVIIVEDLMIVIGIDPLLLLLLLTDVDIDWTLRWYWYLLNPMTVNIVELTVIIDPDDDPDGPIYWTVIVNIVVDWRTVRIDYWLRRPNYCVMVLLDIVDGPLLIIIIVGCYCGLYCYCVGNWPIGQLLIRRMTPMTLVLLVNWLCDWPNWLLLLIDYYW